MNVERASMRDARPRRAVEGELPDTRIALWPVERVEVFTVARATETEPARLVPWRAP